MGHSVLVFVSHASNDKEDYIEPIVSDLEESYINVWIDKRKIVPGDNLRKSIFRDGLDKADIALLFFTEESLKSAWVDKEIKHVLREETNKGNDFDLNKIISIFDSKETYEKIYERYPELTDDLLHLMPKGYGKIELAQLVSAIWSKYLSLQGGDIETQRQLLAKDKELFQKDKTINELNQKLKDEKDKKKTNIQEDEFKKMYESKQIDDFIKNRDKLLKKSATGPANISNLSEARAFGLVEPSGAFFKITKKGQDFFQWFLYKDSE